MAFDTTPICLDTKLEANEELILEANISRTDCLGGYLSLQGLAEGGDVSVEISYSNYKDLGWVPLETITFTDGTMKHHTVETLYPCKFLQYKIVSTAEVTFSLVPCYL